MQGNKETIAHFLNNSNEQIIVPVYQRNYSWKQSNCDQLYDDLMQNIESNKESTQALTHFFGSVVEEELPNGHNGQIMIIDGQQRITSISILLIAICNMIDDGKLKSNTPGLVSHIKENYLIDWYTKDKKLYPSEEDRKAYFALFDSSEDFIEDSQITKNYRHFCSRLANYPYNDAQEICAAIDRLEFIDIHLQAGIDNPQRIFESLNSTGLDLSEADKVCNFVLMDLDLETQKKLFNTYWRKIERKTEGKLSEFLRNYSTLKLHRSPKRNDVYEEFKRYKRSNHIEIEDLLQDITKYANYYYELNHAQTSSDAANKVLKRINILQMDLLKPYLLALLAYYSDAKINSDDLAAALCTIESFIFRRSMTEAPTNSLNKFFATLHNDVLRRVNDQYGYLTVLNYVITHRNDSSYFPHDQEFKDSLDTRNVYHMNPKNKEYLFDSLENQHSEEHVNVVENMKNKTYSIEHIMPQTLSDDWKKDLGPDYQNIHEYWVHKIANLTLTAYNSKYSNRTFINKKTIENGFNNSGFRMNDFVRQCEQWTETELKERNELLKQEFLRLWPFPQSDYQLQSVTTTQHTLDDGFDFTGYKVLSFTFQGTNYKVKTWKSLFLEVVRLCYEINPSIIYDLVNATKTNKGLYSNFSDHQGLYFDHIADGVYLLTNNNTWNKLNIIKKLLTLYDIDSSELTIECSKNTK